MSKSKSSSSPTTKNKTEKEASPFTSRVLLGKAVTPPSVKWLVKKGWAPDQQVAGRIMVLVMITCFVLSALFFTSILSVNFVDGGIALQFNGR
jgi:hypothetical protein